MSAVLEEVAKPLLKLDIGCGKNKKPGFHGVDSIAFDGVDTVLNVVKRVGVRSKPADDPLADTLYEYIKWPYEDNSVEEIHMSHALEHFDQFERAHIFNEMHRVLIKGGKALITVPHWASNRAYGDFTHKWPAVSEMTFYYLNKDWRAGNAPHNDGQYVPHLLTCDFDATWGYSMHPTLTTRNSEYQQHALTFWKEAAQDLIATLTRK